MKTKDILFPRITDPRLIFLASAVITITHMLTTPAFARSFDQLAMILAACFTVDAIFKYLRDEPVFPMSAVISAYGIFVMIDTKFAVIYLLAAFLTVAGKHFIRLKGRHVFNPNNFAIVMIGTFLPNYMSPDGPGRWGGDLNWSIIVSLLGLTLAYRAKRFFVSASFFVFFLVGAYIRSEITGTHILLTTSILFSPGLLVFTYFMITDPKTSPNNWKAQILFSFCVAMLDQVFRAFEFRLSVWLALFIMTAVYAVVDIYIDDKKNFDVWKTFRLAKAPSPTQSREGSHE